MTGLTPEQHGELNSFPLLASEEEKEARRNRLAELRQQYTGDPEALRDIDAYDIDENEYSRHWEQYREALRTGDAKKQAEIEAWLQGYRSGIEGQ